MDSSTSMNGYAFVYLGNKEYDFIAEFSKYGWPALLFSESDLKELQFGKDSAKKNEYMLYLQGFYLR